MRSVTEEKPEVLLSSNSCSQLVAPINDMLYGMNYLESNIECSLMG